MATAVVRTKCVWADVRRTSKLLLAEREKIRSTQEEIEQLRNQLVQLKAEAQQATQALLKSAEAKLRESQLIVLEAHLHIAEAKLQDSQLLEAQHTTKLRGQLLGVSRRGEVKLKEMADVAALDEFVKMNEGEPIKFMIAKTATGTHALEIQAALRPRLQAAGINGAISTNHIIQINANGHMQKLVGRYG